MRGLLMLGLLAGAGWYAYRKLVRSGSGPVAAEGPSFSQEAADGTGTARARVTQAASQAAAAVRQADTTHLSKDQAARPSKRDQATDQPEMESGLAGDAVPPEARAAAMATMPAVQPPATIPEPEFRAP